MKFYTARQAIHDAYALHLRSKGFEVNQVSAVSKPDWSAQMARIQRMKEQPRVAALAEFAPVGHYRGEQSVKLDTDRLIWDSVQAGWVIAAVEVLPPHLKAWCYWCYTPLGKTNQAWLKEAETLAQARHLREQADSMIDYAASIPGRIARCKTEERRSELEGVDTDALVTDAMRQQQIAERLERTVKTPDVAAPWWNWLDEQIVERAPKKIRKKTLQRVRRVCVAACYNYRHRVQPGRDGGMKDLLGPKAICERFDVPSQNFERDYRLWLSWTFDLCNSVDRASCGSIYCYR